jgi:EcsC protein family
MSTREQAATTTLTNYEAEQVEQIGAWKSKPINPVAEVWNLIALQAAKLATVLIPDVVVRLAVESSYRAALMVATPESAARQAGVANVKELRKSSLEECDRLARQVSIGARALATAEGAVTGAGGALTTLIDVPLLFVSGLRTIIRIGQCYGYPADEPDDRYFNLGVLTIATAGSIATRLERLEQLQDLEKLLVEETQVDLVRSELLSFLFQLEVFEEVPGIGVISGALLNLNFMHHVDVTARRVFQERWLKDNGKIEAIAPAIRPAPSLMPGWTDWAGRTVYSACYSAAYGAAFPVYMVASLSGLSGPKPALVSA